MSGAATASKPRGPDRRSRRTLLLIALVAIAPVIASYAVYYFFPRTTLANYGELLPTRPAPVITGTSADGKPFQLSSLHGKWVLAVAAGGACDAACAQALYATRQARTLQGREMDRIVRAWFVTDDATPPAGLAAQHPDLSVVRVASSRARRVAGGARTHLPHRSARQSRPRVSPRSGHQAHGQRPDPSAPCVTDRLIRQAPNASV